MKRVFAGVAVLAALVAIPTVATAHNAGHIILPDGTCLEIGSFKDAPLVGKDRTRLDLDPQTPSPPFDEIGVSFVGHWFTTPILPGPCGPPPQMQSSAGSASSAQVSVKDGNGQTPPVEVVPSGPFYSLGKATRRSSGRERY